MSNQLLDHLVGAQQDRLRHSKAERLGGLEVHSHLVFHRKLHREIAWLRAAQNAIDISGGALGLTMPQSILLRADEIIE
jgi:hypothetical protein